jgi:hypothetical protein
MLGYEGKHSRHRSRGQWVRQKPSMIWWVVAAVCIIAAAVGLICLLPH